MAGGAHQEKPISLFYSYSHRDEALRGELEAHLSCLRRSKLISEWHDRMIGAGDQWKAQIDQQLAAADIILLLISADFIASDYCWGEEMTKALARHQLGEARVIPVILRPCRWQKTPLGSLQAVPRDGKPVSEWSNHDAAFDEIATAIERTIADLQQQRRRAGEQAQQQGEEARKRAEAKARQAVEEQQRDTQRREQDEARRAAEAEAARVLKTARPSDARGLRRLKLIAAVALLILAGFAGVFAWQRWPPQEQPPEASLDAERVGDVLLAQGDRAGALREYQASLALKERLVQQDPDNVEWQRGLAISHERVGDVLLAQGDRARALREYQTSLARSERLAQQDPGNVEWQRDLARIKAKLNETRAVEQ
jgi:hypothetical protein